MSRLCYMLSFLISLAFQTRTCVAVEPFGNLTGRVVFSGEVLERQLLVRKGVATVKDAAICAAQDVLDDSLVVNGENLGIQHVFVFPRRGIQQEKIHPDLVKPPAKEVEFATRFCRFVPHALVLRTDQTLRIRSFDECAHNTHPFSVMNPSFSFICGPGNQKGVAVPFERRELFPIEVKCDLHPWMSAWWLIVDHPYAAITDVNGRFTIPKLPSGAHHFTIWHEKVGYVERELAVTITAGETTDLNEISVDADRFR